MSGRVHTCIDCQCQATGYTVQRRGRHVVAQQIKFSCGAVQEEVFDRESGTGRVEFQGCSCGC